MSHRPGAGTGGLVAVALAIAVVAAYFLVPGGGCHGHQCGSVDDARADQPGAAGPRVVSSDTDTDTDSGTQGPSGQPAPGTGGDQPGAAGGNGGAGGAGTTAQGAGGTNTGTAAGGNGGAAAGGSDIGFTTRIQQPNRPTTPPGADGSGVGADLLPGPLTVYSPTPGGGTQGQLVVNAADHTATGTLAPLVVQDFRGSRAGWTLTATMSDFRSASGHVITADNLRWKPHCAAHGDRSYPSTPVAGPTTSHNRTALLCSAPSSGNVTGGQFDVGADLTLRLDQGAPAGAYSATLLLTLS